MKKLNRYCKNYFWKDSYCKFCFFRSTTNSHVVQQQNRRLRCEIIDLNTGLKYLNESMAASSLETTRYIVHKSLTQKKIVRGFAFAYFSYGMELSLVKSLYTEDIRKKRDFSKEKEMKKNKKEETR